MKTFAGDLEGAALDWAVAKAEGVEVHIASGNVYPHIVRRKAFCTNYVPSTDWSHGGPIIEREKIDIEFGHTKCRAAYDHEAPSFGPTPLIAAMRCYVSSKLGEEIDIPEELL